MSKPVRLPDYLHAEIERLATEEKRSLANMVKVLLEQALDREKWAIEQRKLPSVEGGSVAPDTADAHFKPDFK